MVALIVSTSVGWFLLVVRIINFGSHITFLKSIRLSKRFSIKNWTSQGIRLLKKKFNSFFKCYFSQIQNQSIFKGGSHKSLLKSSIIFSKKKLLQKLSNNRKINNKWKKYKKLFFFYNFICSQFHPIQIKFQIVLIFFLTLDFFQSNSPNYKVICKQLLDH